MFVFEIIDSEKQYSNSNNKGRKSKTPPAKNSVIKN